MSYRALVIDTLSTDAFVMVNKALSKKIGFTEAGLLAELIFTYKTVQREKAFFNDGLEGEWFYLTQAKVQESIGLKRTEHENAIKSLVRKKILQKKKMGLPSKNYYLINWQTIFEIQANVDIVDNVDNSGETPPETAPQSDCRKPANKDVGNLQTRLDETCKLDSRKPTSIHINENDLEKELKKRTYKKTVNKAGKIYGKDELINIGNDFYSEFASGRYSKRQWTDILNRLTTEIVEREVKITDGRAYMKGCLEGIAHKHDLKNGKVKFDYKLHGNLPFYNWLDEIDEQEDELPW